MKNMEETVSYYLYSLATFHCPLSLPPSLCFSLRLSLLSLPPSLLALPISFPPPLFPSTSLPLSPGRRLFKDDHPLEIALDASCSHRNSKLVLRDNTYSTIQWGAFILPELTNFIQILQREEEIYAGKIRQFEWPLSIILNVKCNALSFKV